MTHDKEHYPDGYPSDEAMEAAVEIELMVACGGYATVAYARAIQKAIDKAVAQIVPAPAPQ